MGQYPQNNAPRSASLNPNTEYKFSESDEREKGKEEVRNVIADKYSADKHARHDPP